MRRSLLALSALLLFVGGGLTVGGTKPDLRPIVLTARAGHVKEGEEKQTCHRLTFPRKQEMAISRVQMFVRGGSHHVHLYRPAAGELEYPTKDCPFAVDSQKWQLVVATQNPLLDWQLPPGVAIDIGPRQPLMIQTHFVNTGALDVKGAARAKIKLYPMDPSTVTSYGGALFGQDRTVVVPPGDTTLISRCTMTGEGAAAHDMTIMALTGHYHFRGVEFQVYRVHTDGSLGELIYHHQGYDDPSFQVYQNTAPLVLKAGEGIEWWCRYRNDTGDTFKFGANTARNEHCNLFGFYTPTETPQEGMACIHRKITVNGVEQDDTVRCGLDGVECPPPPPPSPAP